MLKLKYLFENYELAKECLALYDHDEESLDRMLSYFRISSNAIYPFKEGENPDQVDFLRLSPVEEKPLADVLSEIRLIRWLIARGYPAMRPVAMKDGRLADIIDTPWGRYNVSCFAAVPGEALDDMAGTVDIARGYGRSLGKMHNLVKDYPWAKERRDVDALLREIRGRLTRFGAPEKMLTELNAVEQGLWALPKNRDNFGIVHYDYEPDNVFYDEETGEYSVIDFDDAIRCYFALDVVRAIDGLDDVVDESDLKEASAAFLAGYREACPFTEEDESTMPLMRRLVMLQEYATLLYVLSEQTSEEPDWLIALKEKLTARLRRFEASVRN